PGAGVRQLVFRGIRANEGVTAVSYDRRGDKHPRLGRREPVPFAFLAEADRFRSNVTPPPRERASAGQIAGRWLLGLTVTAGLVGSLVIGTPALTPDTSGPGTEQSQASEGRWTAGRA